IVVESSHADLPVGTIALPRDVPTRPRAQNPSRPAIDVLEGPRVQALLASAAHTGKVEWLASEGAGPAWKLFALPLALPPKLLLLGAGPDAAPVVDFASRLSWKVTLVDHRAAYAQADHFPSAEKIVLARPNELSTTLELAHFAAAVVMSH